MAGAPSLRWSSVRELLSTEICCAQGWRLHDGSLDLDRAAWGVAAVSSEDATANLSVVSSTDYALPTRVIDSETLLETQNVVRNASVQVQFEQAEGEAAMDLAEAARLWLGQRSVKERLHTAGISILREPSSTRKTPYIFQGEWVDVASFDLTIAFQTTTREEDLVSIATQFQYTGAVDTEILLGTTILRVFSREFTEVFA